MPAFDIAMIIQTLAVGILPVLLAITVHEVAHGWAARQYGDRTAEMLGRLTLNPLKHVDPFGTVLVPLLVYTGSGGTFLFGWAKPVPVDPRGLRNPKTDMVVVAAAGPIANVLMGCGWAVLYSVATLLLDAGTPLRAFLVEMAQIGVFFNALLAVFNLIPLPPLDGGRVLRGLVPEAFGRQLDAIERFGLIIIVLLLLSGVIGPVLFPLIRALQGLMYAVAGIGGS